MEDLSSKVTGNTLTAAEFVQPMEELQTLIAKAGISLSGADSTQVSKALGNLIPSAAFMTCTGTMPTKVLTTISPKQVITGYSEGMMFRFRSTDINSAGTPTINVDGQGARDIFRMDLTSLQAADIITTVDSVIRYNQGVGAFLLVNPQEELESYASSSVPNGPPVGFTHYWGSNTNPYDPTLATWVHSGPGSCRDELNLRGIKDPVGQNRSIVVPFTTGGTGGYSSAMGDPTGNAQGDWYSYHIIWKKTGEIAYGWDTIANFNTAAGLKSDAGAGWDYSRRLGWHWFDITGQFSGGVPNVLRAYHHYSSNPHEVYWAIPAGEDVLLVPGVASQELVYAPPFSMARVNLHIFVNAQIATSGRFYCWAAATRQVIGVYPTLPDRFFNTFQAGHTGGTQSDQNVSTLIEVDTIASVIEVKALADTYPTTTALSWTSGQVLVTVITQGYQDWRTPIDV